MWVGVSEYRLPRRRLVAGLLFVMGPAFAGCSSLPSMPSSSSFSSLFGSSSDANGAQASAASTLPANFQCPDVTIRQGAATLTSSANPAEPTAMTMRYQVSITTTARECRLLPNNMLSIKVGMQGRVILGPEGSPGPVDVPVRFAVVREGVDPRPIVTKLDRIAVTVTPSESNVLFTHVAEGLEFPMPRGAEIDSYVVYIGFDPAAVQEPKRKPASRRKTS
jgi:hypothetical protein